MAEGDVMRVQPTRLTPTEPSAVYVRFEYGFGTNVYIGLDGFGELGLSIGGWEHLCELVDQYRATSRSAAHDRTDTDRQRDIGPHSSQSSNQNPSIGAQPE
jgi:hypothetical protein